MPILSILTPSHGREIGRALMPPNTQHRRLLIGKVLLALACWCIAVSIASARDHVDGFDGARTSWSMVHDRSAAKVTRHERSLEFRREGKAAELFDVAVQTDATIMQMVYQLPSARLIEDVNLSLWFHSTQDGATLMVRVVFPNQIVPETNLPLMQLIEGDAYTKAGQWQRLECSKIERKTRQSYPLIRRRLQRAGESGELDITGTYVDTAVINIRSSQGKSRFCVDSLKFGPIVEVRPESLIKQIERTEPAARPEAEFQMDQLFVQGQPFVPRIVPYHGESAADLRKMGLNIVWIPEYDDAKLLSELDQAGMRAMAVPPQPLGTDRNSSLVSPNAHLAPFGPETSRILFWYLGTKIAPEEKRNVAAWIEQIRGADRNFRRLVMGDVAGSEESYSRQMSMLGVHRPFVQTSLSLKNYRDWLSSRRNLAHPGCFLWTWVQTEPPASINDIRNAAGWRPMVVEPEQIELQMMAALSAGYRGIAYWTTSSLDDDFPGARERKLMIALCNMKLDLLEPLIATGAVGNSAKFTANGPKLRDNRRLATPGRSGQSDRNWKEELTDRDNQSRLKAELKSELEATVFKTRFGLLVLPVWYSPDSAYVPGQMAANNAQIVAEGSGPSARAWELSLTGVSELAATSVAGGREVRLNKIDVSTAIFFASDNTVVERLREKAKQLAEPAARTTIELAQTKFARVSRTIGELQRLNRMQSDAPNLLKASQTSLEEAEKQLRARRYHEARLAACDALQLLRSLQHIHWSDAVRRNRVGSTVANPHLFCFNTLPDYWMLVERLELATASKNLLPAGECEDKDAMVAAGWTRYESEIPGIQTIGELHPAAHQGTYSLRLAARPTPGQEPPAVVSAHPITIQSPPIPVEKGQIVRISGWVQMVAPTLGSVDGAILYDNILGETAALHWEKPCEWTRFELIRETTESTEVTITLALAGLGDVRFDDLQIVFLNAPDRGARQNFAPAGQKGKPGPLDFLRKTPGMKGARPTQ